MSDEVKLNRKFYPNGQLYCEAPYVNGQVHGIVRDWYENGQLLWEIPYVNGERHGISKGWHENGHLSLEISYVNNQRHGIERWWKEDGKLWNVQKWHRGQRIIDLRFYPIPGDSKMELDLITNEMSYERRNKMG